MLVLNRNIFEAALEREGFSSIGELCSILKIHRNSVSRYLSGAPVLPKVLEAIFERLKINPLTALEVARKPTAETLPELNSIVGAIVRALPDAAVILFGSRAKGTARRYSDIDLGILSKEPLSIGQLSNIRETVEKAAEDLPYQIDLVDLARADETFLDGIRGSAQFIGGNPQYMLPRHGSTQRTGE